MKKTVEDLVEVPKPTVVPNDKRLNKGLCTLHTVQNLISLLTLRE